MSNKFKNPIIDDATPHNIDATLQENLLDLFEYAMKSVAVTLVREATFNTSDFGTAKERHCEGFTLRLTRCADTRDWWNGTFLRGDECLEVLGHLE